MVLEYCEIAKPQGRGNIAYRCFFQDTTRVFRFDHFSKSTRPLDLAHHKNWQKVSLLFWVSSGTDTLI